jgi:hypothetical protein
MNVHGDEWDIILNTPIETLRKFEQIIVEYYNVKEVNGSHYKEMISCFEKMNNTHQVVHVHGNNNCNDVVRGGFLITAILLEVRSIIQ